MLSAPLEPSSAPLGSGGFFCGAATTPRLTYTAIGLARNYFGLAPCVRLSVMDFHTPSRLCLAVRLVSTSTSLLRLLALMELLVFPAVVTGHRR